jgi:hypothetical protein
MRLHSLGIRPVWGLALLAALLSGCAGQPKEGSGTGAELPQWSVLATASAVAWQHRIFPGKQPTQFQVTRQDGREAVRAKSEGSMSVLRKPLRVEAADLGRVAFSWKVSEFPDEADMGDRALEDSAARIVLVFEGDRTSFSSRTAQLSEMLHTFTGEPLPYATLMYVWCNLRPAGTVILNPRTDRVRKLVVQSGTGQANRWLDYQRDIRADYIAAFGKPPGALVGIALMTDSDNTGNSALAWYGEPKLLPVAGK